MRSPYLKAKILEKDSNLADNNIYAAINDNFKKKVLILTDKNIYIQKIFITLNKAYKNYMSIHTQKKSGDSYDLYVIDGNKTAFAPKNGNILYFNPPKKSSFLNIQGELKGGKAINVSRDFTYDIGTETFKIDKMMKVSLPYWAENIFVANNHPLIFYGEKKGQKMVVMAFDPNKSDFPLTSQYPLFMNKAVDFLLSNNENPSTFCYQSLRINSSSFASAAKLKLVSPDKKVYNIKPINGAITFNKTSECGIYTLLKNKTPIGYYPVNYDTSAENKLSYTGSSKLPTDFSIKDTFSPKSVLIFIILFAVAFEWVVRLNEH